MNELVLNISDLLSHVSRSEDQCIDRLMGSLEKRNGIKKVELVTDEDAIVSLHIHFDKAIISANNVKHIATKTADKLDDTFGHLWIKMNEVRDKNQQKAVTSLLKNVKGVMNVLVVPTGWILLEFNTYNMQEAHLLELIGKMDLVI